MDREWDYNDRDVLVKDADEDWRPALPSEIIHEIFAWKEHAKRVKILGQRTMKKADKLKKQRDHYKEQYKILDDMIGLYPHYKRGYEKYLEERAKSEEMKMLRQRVKEQSLLINRLTNEQCQKDAG